MLLTTKKEAEESRVHENLSALITWTLNREAITREELGSHIGISSQTLANWMNKKSDPQLKKLMALARMNHWSLTEFIARLETGLVEAKVMPINRIFGLFSGITSDARLEKPSTEGLITHLKESYAPSSNAEICAVLSETLTIYLGKLISEQGSQRQESEQPTED